LQAAVVGAGLFEVGVGRRGAGRQGDGGSQQGWDHQLNAFHHFVLLVEWECVAPRRLLNGALAFLTQFLNAFLRVLHGLFGLHRLGLALCDASVPLGLFGKCPGLVIFFVVKPSIAGCFETLVPGVVTWVDPRLFLKVQRN
jgi:hypothetical protein